MVKNKRQHYIPASYLAAWCDPDTPEGQTPYIWRFSKDGNQLNKKAPQKSFYETDMYTIFSSDGRRDLHLEYNLSRVEDEFARLRTRKIQQRTQLTSKDKYVLCMFVAAMTARTKVFAKHQSNQWQRVLDMAEKMQSKLDTASPEEREAISRSMPPSYNNGGPSASIEDIRELVDKPTQSLLTPYVVEIAPLLYKKPFAILEITNSSSFITSDNPCVWFDPASFNNPRPMGAGGLISRSLEITLPLSPQQLLFFGSDFATSGLHVQVDQNMSNQLNKRTRLYSDEYCVTKNSTLDPAWF